MTETVLDGIKRASGWSIALGVLIIVLGFVALMAPLATGVVAMYILAWTTIFGGIAQIIYAFGTHACAGFAVTRPIDSDNGCQNVVCPGGLQFAPKGQDVFKVDHLLLFSLRKLAQASTIFDCNRCSIRTGNSRTRIPVAW